jgi:hypothetical protein
MNDKSEISGKIASVGWGLFLVWMGLSFFVQLSPGIGLIGVGVIILGSQLARKKFHLSFELFWVAIGVIFLVSGFSAFSGIEIPRNYIFPTLLIAAGLGVLYSVTQGKRK